MDRLIVESRIEGKSIFAVGKPKGALGKCRPANVNRCQRAYRLRRSQEEHDRLARHPLETLLRDIVQ